PQVPKDPGQHRGIDVAGLAGAVVLAPAAGVVSFAGTVPTNGMCVTIETPDGWSVTLTHLGSIAATRGASVAEGDGVGTIGPSGEPEWSEPYVHLGVRSTDDSFGYVDPLAYLPVRSIDVVDGSAAGVPAGDGEAAAPADPPATGEPG